MEKTLFLTASVQDAYIIQFWARLDALVQMYNERYRNIVFTDLKEKEALLGRRSCLGPLNFIISILLSTAETNLSLNEETYFAFSSI